MRDVCIVGIGQTPVGEHWEKPLRILGAEAILAALADAQVDRPEVLYVGNMLSGQLLAQENLGALLADHAGLRGIEALKVEAACASGAAALRMAYLAVAGGMVDIAVACGVEKMTDSAPGDTTTALASAADAIYEAQHGLSFVALNALLMQRYMHEYGYCHADFAGFAVNAHRNAAHNPNAIYRRPITVDAYENAKMIAEPIGLLDSAGIADGAAAVVLMAADLAHAHGRDDVRILGSAVATDTVALHDRENPLWLRAVQLSTQRACLQAGLGSDAIDFFELHDAFSIMAALSLEAAGFAERGQGVRLALDGEIFLQGRIPICTMGGLKARGHPVGATGIYQVVEATQQLRGQAGKNQLHGCRIGMTQSIGGSGAIAITHILARTDEVVGGRS